MYETLRDGTPQVLLWHFTNNPTANIVMIGLDDCEIEHKEAELQTLDSRVTIPRLRDR
jgi:hypothetical protein